MAALTERRPARSVPCAELLGPAWGSWRGGWHSSRRLIGHERHWVLEDGGRETSCWPDLTAALLELWAQRSVRGDAPWGVGWLDLLGAGE